MPPMILAYLRVTPDVNVDEMLEGNVNEDNAMSIVLLERRGLRRFNGVGARLDPTSVH